MKRKIILTLSMILGTILSINAQLVEPGDQTEFVDSLKHELYSGPYFGLYKDNYFTVGCPVGPKITKQNSGVKFQISIAQRLTKSTLPWNTFLFLMYTQKTFWNVFENSMPMRDMNFNPGIGITKPFFNKGRYVGKMTLLIEHESNGRDSIQSRSWNRISLSGSVMVNDWLMVHAKYWIPIIDGMHNKDILKYAGIFQHGVQITTPDKKFGWGLTLVKRAGWNLNYNTIFEFNWRVHKQTNQYFFVQYYNGYGEGLLDFKQFQSNLRVGLVIKPKFFSEF
ncbi:MAG: phospholipase A [Prevotella sp.]|nr:phospholipase A [Bacteroides sp.]MCM1366183.1 phospholipase A [Prevotella sp.]MCM1436935.1 phospholipase A [Prevotella sp.]